MVRWALLPPRDPWLRALFDVTQNLQLAEWFKDAPSGRNEELPPDVLIKLIPDGTFSKKRVPHVAGTGDFFWPHPTTRVVEDGWGMIAPAFEEVSQRFYDVLVKVQEKLRSDWLYDDQGHAARASRKW